MMLRYVSVALLGIIGAGVLLSHKTADTLPPEIGEWRKVYSSGDNKTWPAPNLHESVKATYQEIGNLPPVSFPADNPNTPAKVQLGKMLFYDPRLSGSGQVACASCHDPQLGWGDGKSLAFGHDRKLGKRNAMTLWNVAFYERLFWDGRALSLEDQARFPVEDHLEMNESLDAMEKRLQKYKGYRPLFAAAFDGDSSIHLKAIFKAIAAFERTIVSPKSRFDLFVNGRQDALTDLEVWGLHLFRTKAGCVNCHNGGLFADNQFHNDGQTLFAATGEDLGLYHVTGNREDVGKFKTPSLREVVHTGPWMHHGNFPTLKDVVFLYNLGNPAPIQARYKGDRDSLLPKTSPMLKKLNMSNPEVDAVIAFLHSIATTPRRINPPQNFPQ